MSRCEANALISSDVGKPRCKSLSEGSMDAATESWRVHDKRPHHRLRKAVRKELRRTRGKSRAFQRAKARTNSRASGDHLPPVSHAKTTKATRSVLMTSPYFFFLSARANLKVLPATLAASGWGIPSAETGLRIVASPTIGRPPYSSNPSFCQSCAGQPAFRVEYRREATICRSNRT